MMDRHDSRAWRLLEALDAAPFGNEKRLGIIQAALDEERGAMLYWQNHADDARPCHVPECSCGGSVRPVMFQDTDCY